MGHYHYHNPFIPVPWPLQQQQDEDSNDRGEDRDEDEDRDDNDNDVNWCSHRHREPLLMGGYGVGRVQGRTGEGNKENEGCECTQV